MIEISRNRSCSLRLVGMLLLCSLCAIVLPPPATADTMYTYTGNLFTFIIPPDTCTAGVGECQISFSFTVASPLPANFGSGSAAFVPPPLSFSMTDGVNTLTPFNATLTIFVGTGPSGQIGSWVIAVGTQFDQQNFTLETVNLSFFSADATNASSQGGGAANFSNPGTWTMSTVPSVPEPSSLFLLGTGLLSIATGLRRGGFSLLRC